MTKCLTTALLFVIALSSLTVLASDVHAVIPVGARISADTVWTKGNTYQLTGAVDVASGITLTIQPGVIVDLGANYLQVDGALYAKGTPTDNIIFTSSDRWQAGSVKFTNASIGWSEQASLGSIIENAFFNRTTLTIEGSSAKINRNTFDNPTQAAIIVTNGSPTISNNIINKGINANGSPRITNNLLKVDYIIPVIGSGNTYLSHNVITGGWTAVELRDQAIFEDNTVMNTPNVGISSTGSVHIQRNYITSNRYGISGGGIIESNTITANKVGIQAPANTATITNNNIYNNSENSVFLTDKSNVDIKNNWWGTIDTQKISQSIHDSNDDFNIGTVNYQPTLLSPSSSAPSQPLIDLKLTPNDWLSSIGCSSSGPDSIPYNQSDMGPLGADILWVAEVVGLSVGIGWAIAIVALVIRRRK